MHYALKKITMKMKKIKSLTLGAALIMGAAAISSCSSDDSRFIGTWTSAAPEAVGSAIDGSTSASAVVTFEFSAGSDKTSGPVKLTKDYTVTLPADSLGNVQDYTVNASVSGTWTRNEKDDDDYTLAFDQNSLSVAAVDGPDGLGSVTQVFLNSLSQYSTIDDVKVSDNGSVLTFELNDPGETKVSFTRAK